MTIPFVGRSRELQTLARVLESGAEGEGGLVLIPGEPGIGKTRLMAEFAQRARADDRHVVWSQMIEDPAAPPFLAWTLVLRECVQGLHPDDLQADLGIGAGDIASIVPELRDRLGLKARFASSDSDAARFQLFDSVTRFLLNVARRKPLLLLFDNLHLHDNSSLALLEYFVRNITASHVAVVLAYRDEGVDHSVTFRNTLHRLASTARVERLNLAGLSPNEVGVLLHGHVGPALAPAWVDAIHAQSDGNPLFVSEVATLLACGRLPPERLEVGFHFQVPPSLRELIRRRLANLPESSGRVLAVAAVLGRDVDQAALTALGGAGREAVASALAVAEAAGIVHTLTPGRFRFHHALFREVLYTEMSLPRRVALHRKAAEYLTAREGSDEAAHIAQLAHHYFESIQADRAESAVHYCILAGEHALSQRAYGEAAAQFERALQAMELMERPQPADRLRILVALGDALQRAGHLVAASDRLLDAALLAHRNESWSRLADIVILFQEVRGRLGVGHVASAALHDSALAHTEDGNLSDRARLLASLSVAQHQSGSLEAGAETLRSAIALARRTRNRHVILRCLGCSMWSFEHPLLAEERLAAASEALRSVDERDGEEVRLNAEISVLFPLTHLGRLREMEERLCELVAFVERERLPHYQILSFGFLTALAIMRGRWREAHAHIEASRQYVVRTAALGLEGRLSFQMFAIHRARGELTALAPLFQRIVAQASASKVWMPGRIILHFELGQLDEARASLERLGDLQKLPRDDLFVTVLVYLTTVCTGLRDLRRCRVLFELLRPYRGLNAILPTALFHGAASGYLAMLAASLRDGRNARALFEEALEMNKEMGATVAFAECQAAYAAFLLQRESAADQAHGERLLSEADAAAQRLELGGLRARIASIRASVSGRVELSERELEVLRLIAEGASNKKIADVLFVSHSTVATHVRNILRKLGVNNRTEAAAHARQCLLVPPS